MKFFNQGSQFRVTVGEGYIDAFAREWPCSGLRGLQGVSFTFEKTSGELVDIHYRNGTSDRWNGDTLLKLSQEAQRYGKKRLANSLSDLLPCCKVVYGMVLVGSGPDRRGWSATTSAGLTEWLGRNRLVAVKRAKELGKSFGEVPSDSR